MADLCGLKAEIKKTALGLCSDCGVADARPFAELESVYSRYAGAVHGEYIGRNARTRADIGRWFPEAKSVLMCAFSYWEPGRPVPLFGGEQLSAFPERYLKRKGAAPENGTYVPARFALCRDYHKEVSARLEQLLAKIKLLAPDAEGRIFVDSSPVAEKPLAQRAGLGFQGRNTLLINKEMGSFLVLGGIALSLALEPDGAFTENLCGDCRRCIESCPTGALSEEGLEVSRCLAYWLNSAQGNPPEELAEAGRGMIAGCDLCQEACPHNAAKKKTGRISLSCKLD